MSEIDAKTRSPSFQVMAALRGVGTPRQFFIVRGESSSILFLSSSYLAESKRKKLKYTLKLFFN